jgi:hypothetical protein
LKFKLEEGRKDVSVERRGVGWSGIPTGPLNGVIEEFYCIFNVGRGFKGNVESQTVVYEVSEKVPVGAMVA